MITAKVKGTIEIDKQHLNKINYRNYIYRVKRQDTFRRTFFIDKDKAYFPRNKNKFVKNCSKEVKFIDETIKVPLSKNFIFNEGFKFRPKQQELLANFTKEIKKGKTDFIIKANTGFGKTVITPEIIRILGQKTLILVDMTMLVHQMYDSIKENTNADVQIVTKDTTKIADINISFIRSNPHNKLIV